MPLYFLMRLQHARLPLRVHARDEIKLVSVLKATGLIEAEIQPLDSTERYFRSQVATVICITDEGKAVLEQWTCEEKPKLRRAEAKALPMCGPGQQLVNVAG